MMYESGTIGELVEKLELLDKSEMRVIMSRYACNIHCMFLDGKNAVYAPMRPLIYHVLIDFILEDLQLKIETVQFSDMAALCSVGGDPDRLDRLYGA